VHAFDFKERQDKILIETWSGSPFLSTAPSSSIRVVESTAAVPRSHTYGIIDTKSDSPKKVAMAL